MSVYAKTNKYIGGLVSIIIPAYQAETFIKRSVNSALRQSYKNIEVIVIENGSTDHTVEVIESIQDKRVVFLRSDKGVSNARNKGIEKASGEFLLFLDADDWLELCAVEEMLTLMSHDVDLVTSRIFGDNSFEKYVSSKYDTDIDDYIVRCLCSPTKRCRCTGHLYRTKFIKSNNVKFIPNLSHAEDSVFFTELLMHRPVVVDYEHEILHVYSNPQSATRSIKKDVSDDFCTSIEKMYALLSHSSNSIKNAGYIFSLNQLLIIFVNCRINFFQFVPYMKMIMQKNVFHMAIEKVDINQISGLMKYIFMLMKKRQYLLLVLAVKGRVLLNSYRRWKDKNGKSFSVWND